MFRDLALPSTWHCFLVNTLLNLSKCYRVPKQAKGFHSVNYTMESVGLFGSQRMPDSEKWKEATEKELLGVRKCMTPMALHKIRNEFPNVKILPSVMVYNL